MPEIRYYDAVSHYNGLFLEISSTVLNAGGMLYHAMDSYYVVRGVMFSMKKHAFYLVSRQSLLYYIMVYDFLYFTYLFFLPRLWSISSVADGRNPTCILNRPLSMRMYEFSKKTNA